MGRVIFYRAASAVVSAVMAGIIGIWSFQRLGFTAEECF
jgi:hypothetical protein